MLSPLTQDEIHPKPTVHDHYEGSMFCRECGGPCHLTGPDLAYTELVRFIFEQGPPAGMVRCSLEAAGVDLEYHERRVKSRRSVYAPVGSSLTIVSDHWHKGKP